jgi:hypothetical protein
MPVWIEPYYGFRTPMCEAIAKVGQHIYEWSKAFLTSFPAIVCNVSDGMVTDSPYQGADLAEWARRLTTIQTDDGPTLLLNVFLSPNKAPIVSFPSSPDTLPEPGALLFSISSPLPDPMKENARSAQINVAEGARGQPGLQGVDVSWSGWERRGSEQVSGDRRGSSGDGPGAGATARRVDRVFSATARAQG